MVEEAQFGIIRVGVRYKTIGGVDREDMITIHTCR
jgi:hypothetical protein